ncbi:Disease resistance protein [Quillaja saponaria]|uniref:Disease resistance protein n=1 Tax=Quillaja saponaria TaxID=32244 RepID=A0AAD7Q5M8_QUISA|nr:Disease resistance protein [Quillaja saponaria]
MLPPSLPATNIFPHRHHIPFLLQKIQAVKGPTARTIYAVQRKQKPDQNGVTSENLRLKMAEIAVSSLVDKLIGLLVEEVKLLKDVQKKVADIKEELESIQSFLKDADLRAEKEDLNCSMKTWVKQVREVAYEIEDVIDQYMLHVAQGQYHHGFMSFVNKPACLIKLLKLRHRMAAEIQHIRSSFREIKERSVRYGFNSLDQQPTSDVKNSTWHDPRVAWLFIEEAEVVGVELTKDELIGWLVEGPSKRIVISLVGMGGLGKTTLAKKVCENQLVTGCFDCHTWITVSQSYKVEEILRYMIKQLYQARKESVPEGIDTLEEMFLIGKLRECLQDKRYLVVFDDVWKTELWSYIKHALPDNNKGSRIIITTRIDDVAYSCKYSPLDHVHKLQPLPQDKSWELFCKRAFQSDFGGQCPPELEKLSLEIANRCRGLPLAIVAIGGLLSTKRKVVSEWQKFLENLRSELESNPHLTNIIRILSLSYHDLPYHLKSCFLYFGVFPEDYSVSCVRLIRLWIAEGFVKGVKSKTLEQVAEEYLAELIDRSLVQVSWVDSDGKARTCQVHDLMREIILSKIEELNFCQVLEEENPYVVGKVRRLSFQINYVGVLDNIQNHWARSIFLFKIENSPNSIMNTFCSKFKLLKVLEFGGAPLCYLPKAVGNLFHLRYLSIRDTKIKVLPESIGKLRNLETLDLKRSLVCVLPIEINKLQKLRHLLAYNYNGEVNFSTKSLQGCNIQEGFGSLEALQKLYFIEADNGARPIQELSKLQQLRKLGITKLATENGKVLCSSIEQMKHL